MKTSSPSVIKIGGLRFKKYSVHRGGQPGAGAFYTCLQKCGAYSLSLELAQFNDHWSASGHVEDEVNDVIASSKMFEGDNAEDVIDSLTRRLSNITRKLMSTTTVDDIESLERVINALNYA